MNRFFKQLLLAISDAAMVVFSFLMACKLARYPVSAGEIGAAKGFAVIVAVQLAIFWKFGLYKAVLRYASIDFLVTVLKAVSVAIFALVFSFYVIQVHISANVLFINWLLAVFLIGGARLVIRCYFELVQRYKKGRRVLIYGAGDMGIIALRQLKLNKDILYSPVGFIDDDASKHGSILQGVKVAGSADDIESFIDRTHTEEIVVAIADIESEKLRNIVKRCRQKNIPCRILPCFSKLLEVEPHMRNIELADLMRRSSRDLDKKSIEEYLLGKNVLITGAAGSIGSELVRQSLSHKPFMVTALDQSEYGLYALKEELGSSNVKYCLGDVTDINYVENVFKTSKPDIVFHAAAYKHVPMLEYNPIEAIKNNVGGTMNLSLLADKYGVKSFVLISTDKAVRPSSVMGATKRVAELFLQNYNRLSNTEFVAVRFGNVLGSSGSVIPKFLEQIKNGGPVTVTHPEATRYFMLIDEAVQLVLQAAAIGKGGEIFILNMGKPVKIAEMAEDLIYLTGRQPHSDIKIEYTGLREGEKIYEELFNDEIEERTRFEDITIGKPVVVDWNWLDKKINDLLISGNNYDHEKVLNLLKELITEPVCKYDNKILNGYRNAHAN